MNFLVKPPFGINPQRTLEAILRTDLYAFTAKAFETVSPGDAFMPNWHIEAMANALAKVMRGDCKRLIITVPPRHLKSIAASVALPAFMLGHDPTKRIIGVSYAHDLAIKHANDCRAVMNSDWYRKIFLHTRLDPSKNTELEFMTTKRGFRFATSVGGTLTGRGGNLIIIDDPIKPAEANSEAARDRVTQWCANTLVSRLDDKSRDAMVLVMQRVHADDLVQHFLTQEGWEQLNLPAIADIEQTIEVAPNRYHTRKIGDLLHPERESIEVLERMKLEMGSATYSAQYQQSPIPPGGNMIDWKWFSQFDLNAQPEFNDIVISWDTAMKPTELSDYSVGTVWGIKGDFFYLLDLVRLRLDYPNLRRKVIEVYQQWRYSGVTLIIEDAGSGTSLIQDLKEQNIAVIPIKPEGDKVLRVSAQSAKIEAGAVHLPQKALWLDDLRNEVLAFPHGRHDDQVDSIAQALNWISRPRARYVMTTIPMHPSYKRYRL
jgi:predicted phage terminase large subunit-like protein